MNSLSVRQYIEIIALGSDRSNLCKRNEIKTRTLEKFAKKIEEKTCRDEDRPEKSISSSSQPYRATDFYTINEIIGPFVSEISPLIDTEPRLNP